LKSLFALVLFIKAEIESKSSVITFILLIWSNPHLADDRIHTEVRETIFTEGYIYKWQAYVKEVPNEAPRAWIDPPTIIEYAWLVSVLQPYPTAIGHFAHEVLVWIRSSDAHPSCIIRMKA
jgi:hypothetical protein